MNKTGEEIQEIKKETCKTCGEITKIIDGIYETYRDCKCQRDERQKLRVEKYKKLSIIDKNSELKTFLNSKPINAKEKEIQESFKRYCKNFKEINKNGFGIIMLGNAGTGKTFYSACIFNELIKNYNCISINFSKYFGYLKQNNFEEAELKFQQDINEVDLVIIDDVGSEKISEEWGKEKVFNLIDFLYRNNKSIIITTNCNLKELNELLDFRGSDKIIDRLKERCKTFAFDWEGRRKNMNKDKFEELF